MRATVRTSSMSNGSPGPGHALLAGRAASENPKRQEQYLAAVGNMQACANVICDFLQSKCLVSAERALRAELELMLQRSATNDGNFMRRNLWQSRLEKLLDVRLPSSAADMDHDESPQVGMLLSQVGALPTPSGGTPTEWSPCYKQADEIAGNSCNSTPSRRLGVRLHQLHPSMSDEEGAALRKQRSRSSQQSCVVFREGKTMSTEESRRLETLMLPLLYNP